jgi:hypothetical protein
MPRTYVPSLYEPIHQFKPSTEARQAGVALADIAEHAEHAQHTDINTTRKHCIVPSVDLTTGRQTACRASPGKEEHAVKTAFRAGFGRVAGALCNPLKLLARRKRFELLPPNSKSVPSV